MNRFALLSHVALGSALLLPLAGGCGRSSLDVGGRAEGAAASGGSATSTTSSTSTSTAGASPSCDGATPWSLRWGSASELESADVALVLPDCAALVGGVLRGTDPGTEAGLFLRRIDRAGGQVAARLWGDGDGNLLRGLGADGAGHLVVAGMVWGSIDFGGAVLTSSGQWNMVIASLEADGSHRWSALFGGPDSYETTSMAVDIAGNIVLAGQVTGPVDFGGGLLVPAGSWDLALASFTVDATHRWSRLIGDEGIQLEPRVAIGSDGWTWLGGWFAGRIDFGLGPLEALGEDAYLVRLDGQGQAHSTLQLTGPGSARLEAVAAAPDGGAVGVGQFSDELAVQDETLQSAGQSDGFVVRVDSSAIVRWAVPIGGTGNERASSVSVADDGRIVVGGTTNGAFVIGGQSYQSAGQSDIFVAVLADDGELSEFALYGDPASQFGPVVAALPDRGYVLAGGFEGQLTFDGPITSAGGTDAFAALVR